MTFNPSIPFPDLSRDQRTKKSKHKYLGKTGKALKSLSDTDPRYYSIRSANVTIEVGLRSNLLPKILSQHQAGSY